MEKRRAKQESRTRTQEELQEINRTLRQEIEELKRENEMQKESVNRFKDTLNFLPVTIYELDTKGIIKFVNLQALELFGYTREEVDQGFNFLSAIAPEDHERAKANIAVLFKGERLPGNEYTAIHKDGSRFPILVQSTQITEDDKVIGLRGTIIDLSEIKRAEEKILSSEQKYRQVVENASEIIFTLDLEGYFQFVNPSGLKLAGYSLEEMKKFRYTDLLLPDHRNRIKIHYMRQYLSRKAVSRIEYPFRTKEGKIVWLSQNATLNYKDDKIVGFHLIARNVTERKKFEDALQASEKKYRELFENANEGICIIQDMHIKFMNPKLLEIIGYTYEEILSRPYYEFIHPHEREKTIDRFKRRIQGEKIDDQATYRIINKTGKSYCIEVRSLVIDWENRPATLNFVNDITTRMQAEIALRNSEKRFRDISFSLADYIWEVDRNFKYTYISESVKETLGYKPEEMLGVTCFNFKSREEAIKLQHLAEEAAARKKSLVDVECWTVRKDGKQIATLSNCVPILDEHGNCQASVESIKTLLNENVWKNCKRFC